jgi:hypothetical protein
MQLQVRQISNLGVSERKPGQMRKDRCGRPDFLIRECSCQPLETRQSKAPGSDDVRRLFARTFLPPILLGPHLVDKFSNRFDVLADRPPRDEASADHRRVQYRVHAA